MKDMVMLISSPERKTWPSITTKDMVMLISSPEFIFYYHFGISCCEELLLSGL